MPRPENDAGRVIAVGRVVGPVDEGCDVCCSMFDVRSLEINSLMGSDLATVRPAVALCEGCRAELAQLLAATVVQR